MVSEVKNSNWRANIRYERNKGVNQRDLQQISGNQIDGKVKIGHQHRREKARHIAKFETKKGNTSNKIGNHRRIFKRIRIIGYQKLVIGVRWTLEITFR